MKQILTSMKDAAISRIRSPIIGAFIFSWIALNIKGASLFLLSTTLEKKVIIQNWAPNYVDDGLLPLGLAAFYLLVLPWLQLLYQALDEGILTKFRQEIKNGHYFHITEVFAK